MVWCHHDHSYIVRQVNIAKYHKVVNQSLHMGFCVITRALQAVFPVTGLAGGLSCD